MGSSSLMYRLMSSIQHAIVIGQHRLRISTGKFESGSGYYLYLSVASSPGKNVSFIVHSCCESYIIFRMSLRAGSLQELVLTLCVLAPLMVSIED